jgi:phage-related protein
MAANMQQIRNTGKATAMDIRQFANAGINIYGVLADSLGITAAQAAEMDVTYEQLAYALQHAAEAGGMFEGAMEAQSQTFNGRMSTLKDNVTQLEGALTEDLFNQLSGNYLPMLMDWVATLLEATQTGGIDGAIGAAKEIVTNLATQLIEEAPSIIKAGVELVVNLANTFVRKIPDIISAGVRLLSGLISSLSDSGAVEKLLHAAGEIVRAIWTGLIQNGPQILEAAAKLIGMLLRGILQYVAEVAQTAMELATVLIDTIKNTDWLSVGKNIIDGITEGFIAFWNNLSETVVGAMQNLWESVKGFFGIASPSKKFKWIGEMNVEGMIEGMEDQQAELTRTVRDVYGGVPDTAIDAMRYMGDMERNVSFNMTATGSMADTQITVPLFLDGREIARATAWSMGQQLAWEEI